MVTEAHISRITVVGAGQMGCGIAQVCAMAGYSVALIDANAEQLTKARASITKSLDRLIQKGQVLSSLKEITLDHLTYAKQLESDDSDLLVEAVNENVGLKTTLLRQYSELLKPEAIIATNTSSISITQLAMVTNRPDKVIGMHFMNPVPVMKLVEVIRSLTTSDETFNKVSQVITRLEKTQVTSQDSPGFIVNRILMPMINEAIFALHEGIATAKDIDAAMVLGTNQPMGPLALADLIGLDTCLSIMQVLYQGFCDSKYRPCPLLTQKVTGGQLGRKTGRGFYVYA